MPTLSKFKSGEMEKNCKVGLAIAKHLFCSVKCRTKKNNLCSIVSPQQPLYKQYSLFYSPNHKISDFSFKKTVISSQKSWDTQWNLVCMKSPQVTTYVLVWFKLEWYQLLDQSLELFLQSYHPSPIRYLRFTIIHTLSFWSFKEFWYNLTSAM